MVMPASMTILQGSFGGAFQEVSQPGTLPHEGGGEYMVLPVDADQDGVLELVLLGATTILFDRAPGDANTFNFVQSNQLQASFADQKVVATADANVDGRDDLLFFGTFGTSIIQNFGNGVFGQLDNSFVGLASLGPVQQATIVDLDNDGDEDWILGTSDGLQIWKSNRAQKDPNFRYIRVEIKRYPSSEQFYTPMDNHGPILVVESLTQQELDDDEGLLVSIAPERTMVPRLNVPTIITLGAADGAHIEVRYVDKGLIGSRLRQVTGLSSGETSVIYARE